MRKFALCFIVFGILFIGFHKVDNDKVDKNYADYEMVSFDEKTVVDSKLVLFDNTVDYIKYHVVYFSPNGGYVTHVFEYLRDSDEYLNEYENVYENILDYDYDQLMIRYVKNGGIGTYGEILSLYQPSIDLQALSIVY